MSKEELLEHLTEESQEIEKSAPAEPSEAVEAVEAAPVEVSLEDQAKGQGWTPKEDFKGNTDDWVSAKEFVERGPIFDHIKKLNKRLSSVAEYNQKIMAKLQEADSKGYQRALGELEQHRAVAIDEGGDVRDIDAQIAATREDLQKSSVQGSMSPEVVAFARKNSDWFGKDPQLTQMAVSIDNMVRSDNAIKAMGLGEDEIIQEVEKRMAPYLGKPESAPAAAPAPVPKAPPVAPGSRSGVAKKESHSFHDLTDDAQEIYKAIKSASPDLTVDKWIQRNKELNLDEADLLRG